MSKSDDFPMITVPAEAIYPGDLMDRALDRLQTVHLALTPENSMLISVEK